MTEKNNNNKLNNIPALALRGLTVFPDMLMHFDIGREKSINALNEAVSSDQVIFLVAQKDLRTDDPLKTELYKIGTIANIRQVLKLPGDNVRVLVEGVSRAKIIEYTSENPFYQVNLELLASNTRKPSVLKMEAAVRHVKELFEEYSELAPKMTHEVVLNVMAASDPGYLADYIAQNISIKLDDKQRILEKINPFLRLEALSGILEREIEILDLEHKLYERVHDQVNKNQRDYYLREQMKAIQNELGESEENQSETEAYIGKIKKLKLNDEDSGKLIKEAERLSKMQQNSPEASVIRTYLDTCLSLPWNKTTKDRIDIVKAESILDKEHFGLDKVKQRILEFLAVKQLAPKLNSQILCLVGPPGVGKTSIALSVAHALGRKQSRLSLGGVRDEADIRGHRKTYIGAMPGRIINAVQSAGSKNPVILLDEVDKLGNDFRGDPSAALLEVLDPAVNATFRDHYIEIPFDLSEVMFITTANTVSTIPRPLLDRMELIELSSYTDEEKLQIAKRHLIPKNVRLHGLKPSQIRFADNAIREIIASYTRESGVRILERQIAAVCRKAAKSLVSAEAKRISVRADNLEKFLGTRKYFNEKMRARDEIGVVNGLAWTSVGGEILEVEANVMTGTGKIEITGNLGDVMKESARAAFTYIRSRAKTFGIDPEFYKKVDLHVHFPEGAVPKDGPSAGVTMAVAMVSALTGLPAHKDVAMTGEITLRGRVMPIGGLKEKTMAALRAGIKTIIVPHENEPDLEEIDQTVRKALHFVFADHVDKVIENAIDFTAKKVSEKENNLPILPDQLKEPISINGDTINPGIKQ